MNKVNIPTGEGGHGFAVLELQPDYPVEGMVSLYAASSTREGANKAGVCADVDLFIKGVEEALNVTVTPNTKANAQHEHTTIHELTETLNASIPDKYKPWQPVVGAQVEAYWQLTRAKAVDAVLMDKDGEVWALDYDDEGDLYYVPATHETVDMDEGDPEGADITDLYPATVIYVRGQYTD